MSQARSLKPRKPNWLTFIRAAPGLISEWDGFRTVVPEEFVSADADLDSNPLAVVACPCGESPAMPVAGSKACNCRRVFLNLGTEVRVWRPPLTDEEYAPEH